MTEPKHIFEVVITQHQAKSEAVSKVTIRKKRKIFGKKRKIKTRLVASYDHAIEQQVHFFRPTCVGRSRNNTTTRVNDVV